MPSKADWPHPLHDAIAAKIILWAGTGLGVRYVFPGGDGQRHPIGTRDQTALGRLERAGKLSYVDDDARDRYEAMKRAGIFCG
jgi:hypothetical protein